MVGGCAGAAVVALWLVLSRERVAGGLLLAASAGPALAVGAWAFTRPALVEDVALRADREADGAVFGVLALAGAALAVLLVALVVPRLGESVRRPALQPYAQREIVVGLRPEDMAPAADGANAGPSFSARLEYIEPVGNEIFLNLRLGGRDIVARVPPMPLPAAGSDIRLAFLPEKLHCFDPQSGKRIV